MRKLLLLIAIIYAGTASAQWTRPNTSYGTKQYRISIDSTLLIPTGCGIPANAKAVVTGDTRKAGIYFDSCAHAIYVYDPTTADWSSIAGSSAVDSVTVYQDSIIRYWVGGVPSMGGTVRLAGGGTDYNFANANLVATADRFHDFDGHSLNISTGGDANSTVIVDTSGVQLRSDKIGTTYKSRLTVTDAYASMITASPTSGSTVETFFDSLIVKNIYTGGRERSILVSKDSVVNRFIDPVHLDSNYVQHFPKNFGFIDTLATLRDVRGGSVGGGGITQGQLDDSTAAIRAALAAGTTVNPKFNPFADNNIFRKDYAGVIYPTAPAVAASPITWALYDTTSNGVHNYYGFDSIGVNGTNIRVHYAPVKFVVSLVVTPDEKLSGSGIFCGASVGTSNADISAYRLSMNAGKLTGNGTTAWTASGLNLSVNSYSSVTGLTSITPTGVGGNFIGASNEIEGTQLSYVGTNNYHIQRKYSGLGGLVGFYLVENLTNNIVTGNLSTTDVVSIVFARPQTLVVPANTVASNLYPSDIYITGSNYWLRGTFDLWFRAYPLATAGNVQTVWQAYKIGSNYATNYRITRAPLSSPGTETTIYNAYGFTYTDTGATSGTQYIYRMYATVSAVEALVTNEKCIAP